MVKYLFWVKRNDSIAKINIMCNLWQKVLCVFRLVLHWSLRFCGAIKQMAGGQAPMFTWLYLVRLSPLKVWISDGYSNVGQISERFPKNARKSKSTMRTNEKQMQARFPLLLRIKIYKHWRKPIPVNFCVYAFN